MKNQASVRNRERQYSHLHEAVDNERSQRKVGRPQSTRHRLHVLESLLAAVFNCIPRADDRHEDY